MCLPTRQLSREINFTWGDPPRFDRFDRGGPGRDRASGRAGLKKKRGKGGGEGGRTAARRGEAGGNHYCLICLYLYIIICLYDYICICVYLYMNILKKVVASPV